MTKDEKIKEVPLDLVRASGAVRAACLDYDGLLRLAAGIERIVLDDVRREARLSELADHGAALAYADSEGMRRSSAIAAERDYGVDISDQVAERRAQIDLRLRCLGESWRGSDATSQLATDCVESTLGRMPWPRELEIFRDAASGSPANAPA